MSADPITRQSSSASRQGSRWNSPSGVQYLVEWVDRHSAWLLLAVAPLLLFPTGVAPYLACAATGLLWLCAWLAGYRRLQISALDLLPALLGGLALLGWSISIDPDMSRARFWSILLGVLIFFTFKRALRTESGGLRMAQALAILALGMVALSLVGTDWDMVRFFDLPGLYGRLPHLSLSLPGSGVPRANDLFNPRWVGNTAGMLAPLFTVLLAFGQGRRLRILSGLALAATLGLLLLSQSLPGLVGLLAGLLLIAAWRDRRALGLLPVGAGLLAAGFLWAVPARAALYLLSPQNPVGLAIALRLDIWSRALAMLRDMPYTGIGLNTFPLIQSKFYPGFLLGLEPHAHNIYLQTALDLGLPGLVAFLGLILAWLAAARNNFRRSSDPSYRALLVGLAAGVVAYLVLGLLDGLMLGAKPVVFLWMMLGIGAAGPLAADSGEKAQRKRWSGLLPLAILLLAILVSTIVWPSSWRMNRASIAAHRLLEQAPGAGPLFPTQVQGVIQDLQAVIAADPERTFAFDLLGRLYAWSGDDEAAWKAFTSRVALDMADPRRQYDPAGYWSDRIRLVYAAPVDDLLEIYSHWQNRYPQQAEGWARTALVWALHQNNPLRACHTLQEGMAKGARPIRWLEFGAPRWCLDQ